MDTIQQPASATTSEYRSLGTKTFILFLLDRIRVGMIFLLVAIVLFVLGGQSFLAQSPVGNLQNYATLGGWYALALMVIAWAIALLVSWLVYTNYRFALDEDSLKIKRGVLNKEEIAIPYRQIQDVAIDRDLAYQALGMSRLDILTAGHEDEREDDSPVARNESEGILPALDRAEAEWLRNELLKRTDIQRVTEVKAN